MVRKILSRRPSAKGATARKLCMQLPFRSSVSVKKAMVVTLATMVASSSLSLPWPSLAEVAVTGQKERKIGVPADYGSLGDIDSKSGITCWQQGKEIFSDKNYNTVLLGALASESAITLKNNNDGEQALAVSLGNGLCFVTIKP